MYNPFLAWLFHFKGFHVCVLFLLLFYNLFNDPHSLTVSPTTELLSLVCSRSVVPSPDANVSHSPGTTQKGLLLLVRVVCVSVYVKNRLMFAEPVTVCQRERHSSL